ncbi:MAG: 3-dehydroquinate synthase [Dehalococcoidia bacterium]|nr:3-dehydroquinate synthase [Dehalococcoidia bacterium]
MENLILTGFSGTGKSAVGKAAARLLGWEFVDTDELVVQRAGKSVEDIFAQDGEKTFRSLEREAIRQALAKQGAVIATGGGAFAQDDNRELMLRSGVVVCLEADAGVIVRRLFGASAEQEAEVRPLLAGNPAEREERVRALKAQRQAAYAKAQWTVHTDRLSVEEAAREVVRAWDVLRRKLPASAGPGRDGDLAAVVHSSAGVCPIYLGWGLLGSLGERCRAAGLTTTAYLFTDSRVGAYHAAQARAALEEAGIRVRVYTVPAGEASKSLEQAGRCYAWLAELRAERGHFVVALGGGVVGDLAGFVAATFARGLPFVQVPTSLAAMVDASIGGKTAVDLPAGKNLVGAFHQPRLVLADLQTLTTLPARELASGWAEALKHGLILDEGLVRTFEEDAQAIQRLEPAALSSALKRSAAIKADIVSQDERETLGVRTVLNYGHTLGHALEAATGYQRLLHGEAVAIGMHAAGLISRRMGLLSEEGLARQDRLLQRYGLPLDWPAGVDTEAVLSATQVDKKTAEGKLHWVLLEGIGRAVVREDVPPDLVRQVVRELAHTGA